MRRSTTATLIVEDEDPENCRTVTVDLVDSMRRRNRHTRGERPSGTKVMRRRHGIYQPINRLPR